MDIAILGSARTSISMPFAGGMEMHTHALAEGLSRLGHWVTVYAADADGDFEVQRMQPIRRESGAGRLDLCDTPLSERSERESYADAMTRLATAGHDVVHLNTIHYLPFGRASTLPSAVTGTLHSPPYPELVAALRAGARTSRPVSFASISHTNAAAWQREVGAHRIIVNGVDLRCWTQGHGGSGAIWTGRMVAEKAPHLAIDAARLAGLPMLLLGPLHDDDYFRHEIVPRLGHGIDYGGHASMFDLARAVAAADVAVVSPVWDEPFGLVVAEALACGTPVAAFERGAMRELLTPRTGALAAANDVVGLAAAIEVAARLDRDDCRAHAVLRFGAQRMVAEYEAWFDQRLTDDE